MKCAVLLLALFLSGCTYEYHYHQCTVYVTDATNQTPIANLPQSGLIIATNFFDGTQPIEVPKWRPVPQRVK